MTTPGALPPPRSIYDAPTTPPSEMTPAEKAAFATATVAAVVASTGEQKQSITTSTVLLLVPMLRALNPFDDNEVERFATKAAELVEMGRQETAKVSWSAVQQYLAAYDVALPSAYARAEPGRATSLEVAYRRVAADYRRRIAAGTESIQKMIAQAEEERFQALGGAEVAAQRTGESNAEIQGQERSLGASRKAQPADRAGTDRGGSASAGARERDGRPAQTPVESAKPDREVNAQRDDWDAEDNAARAERERQDAEDAAADAAAEAAEAELRRQAELTEREREQLLEQVAQQEMEVRMERMVNDDLAMASRTAARDAMLAGKVTRYRRVLHPELNQTGVSCGLCVAASTRLYRVKDLMPIHNLCKCEPVPVVGGNDPGEQINMEDLGVLYDEAGGTTDGRELKAERYVVYEHPELGPVLRNAKHSMQAIKFSGREASEDHKLNVKKRQDEYHRQRAEKFGTSK